MTSFVLATANPDKVTEIRQILAGFDLQSRPNGVPEVVEDADTLYGNALLKAQALCVATGLPAIADDTGLEVDALGGAPGVKSARFAGPEATYAENVDLLLSTMESLPVDRRTARFRTVALAVFPDGTIVWAEGVVEGEIARVPMGQAGFGYDPVFLPIGKGDRSFAQMALEEKNAISHRGRAFVALAKKLQTSV